MSETPGWLASHMRTPYPFVGPGVPLELEDTDYRTLFVDASVRYTLPVPYGSQGAEERQLKLVLFSWHGSLDAASSQSSASPDPGLPFFADIVLDWEDETDSSASSEAQGPVFFDSRDPGNGVLQYTPSTWGEWAILEWVYLRDIDDASDYDRVVRVLLDQRKLDAFVSPVEPAAAYLVPSLVSQSSSKVTTLRFVNHSGGESVLPNPALPSPSADVTLASGYNTYMELSDSDPLSGLAYGEDVSVRQPSRLTLGFEPGAGAGRYPGCTEPEEGIRTINGQAPDAGGNFGLTAEECYWVERPLAASVQASLLKIRNFCHACCECEDYSDVYTRLAAIWQEVSEALDGYNSVKSSLVAAIANFNSKIADAALIPQITSYMRHSWLLTGQAMVCNSTGEELTGINITFTLESDVEYVYVPGSAWIVTPQSQRRLSDAAGHAQAITISEKIPAGACVIFEYEVYFIESSGRAAEAEVTWTLCGDSESYEFYLTKTDWLEGPFNH